MDELSSILDRNKAWSAERQRTEPGYFDRLAAVQDPDILWIGCSDSRVPADTVTGLTPGEIFVHRNVANIVYAADLNCMSVVHYAVEVLRVSHIIVCGHYGCGGVITAYENRQNGLIDHWLEPIKTTARRNRKRLRTIDDKAERINLLCELNVKQQVMNVANSPIVVNWWNSGHSLSVHGWIYGLHDGLLQNLKCTRTEPINQEN